MKDARESLIQVPGINSHNFNQVRSARVQPAPHHRWQCKVIFILKLESFVPRMGILAMGGVLHAATGSYLKSSPYFRIAHAMRAFLAAMAIAARQ